MPLSQPQREHLARRLREERARVLRALGRGDGAFAATEQDASRLTRELEEISAALERIRGEPARYGRDERTGEESPFERLDRIPWARERAGEPSAGAAARRAAETDLRAAEHNERYAG